MDECVELLTDSKVNLKGARMLAAMKAAAKAFGMKVIERERYSGDCKYLLMYGMGHPVRRFDFERHSKVGVAIGLDLGYYARGGREYPMRISINAPHPQDLMRREPGDRWDAAKISLRNDWNPDGKIVLAGLGRKARVQFGYAGTSWERSALEEIRRLYPEKTVLYRPKAGAEESIGRVQVNATGSIESVIGGSSLVVVRHSNVAVDACIAGVPVVCEDGAAAYLYGSDLARPKNPSVEERLEFMRSLAWWQWTPCEAVNCWEYIFKVVAERVRQ